MPPLQTRRPTTQNESRDNGTLAVPIVLGGVAVAAAAGFWLWRRKRAVGGEPAPGAVLVASTAPGQPEII